MIHAVNGSEALGKLREVPSPGTGIAHWGTEFFGPRYATEDAQGPQSLMTAMSANEVVLPHYHEITQYQLFVAGAGKMGKNELLPLTVQYKDHHTAYGPVVAGPQGMTFCALRIRTAKSVPVYMNKPGYREQLKPSKRRNLISAPIILSTEPVLEHRKEVSSEALYPADKTTDGMSAQVLRLGAGMSAMGPDPGQCGGYYLFVANGSLDKAGENFLLWSMVVVESNESAFEIKAGSKGLEVLVLQFPREDE